MPPAAQAGVTAVSAGYQHALALSGGQVVQWGISDPTSTFYAGTVPQEATSGVDAIAAGWLHSLALKDGRVIAWGNNFQGQATVPVEAQSGVTAIAAGQFFSAAVKDGRVIVWGNNDDLQRSVPQEALSGVTAIAANSESDHILALKGGSVIAWGAYAEGQTLVPASARSNAIAIAAGGTSSLALVDQPLVNPPQAVTSLRAVAQKGSIRVSWNPPADLGGAESVSYQYRVGRQAWLSAPAMSVTVRGKKGVRITVQVRAVNEAGVGPSLSVSSVPR